jgi:putative FmdB family regulatory protein
LPTYEYACTVCGHRLEAVQKFTDDPLTECPECGAALRKVYGAVGIVLKGSGFYKTDSRAASGSNGSGKKGADTQSGDSSGGDSTPKKESSASEKGSSDKSSSDKSGSGKGSSDKSSSDKGGSGNGSSGTQTAAATSTAG